MSPGVCTVERRRARVRGIVQGVGFRPHVHRLAAAYRLDGFVLNDGLGVLIEIEGERATLDSFLSRLVSEAPPLARVDRIETEATEPRGESGFAIRASAGEGRPRTEIGPDTATCSDCLREIADPVDRRYRYPFTTCTDCGPRYTIVEAMPFDRANTTMARFEMCARCRAEYESPTDRRFHAQANACPDCGPTLRLLTADGEELGAGDRALIGTGRALAEGLIVAIKGLGGYHLACRADSERAVAELRSRKRREEKPLALMARDLDAAERLIELGPAERRLLVDPRRPIVVGRRRHGPEAAAVAASVAPANPDLGVMLPYTPLHELLLSEAGTDLVMTSGNVSDEPIAYEDDEARHRLASIADRFCVHDRPIHVRVDDSVVRARDRPGFGTATRPLVIRRARGWTPVPLSLPVPARRPLLAVGAELKSTFTLAQGELAWVSEHLGDLSDYETLSSFERGIVHLRDLLEVEPVAIARDLHPDYLSSGFADRSGLPTIEVQHHHAHLAAVLAEHGLRGPAVGAIFDGAGLGPDETVWGGEILSGDLRGSERQGLLFPVRLPGGDAAARRPWRMACSWLTAISGRPANLPAGPLGDLVDPGAWSAVAEMCASGVASPLTTSVGRLFDAVAALCGLRTISTYEGQAAIELESRASLGIEEGERGVYPLPLLDQPPGPIVLDARETVEAIGDDLRRGAAVERVAARFHAGLATATVEASAAIAARAGLDTVVLAGGVFGNRLLASLVSAGLERHGLRPLLPLELPPGDGSISYGQAATAAARMRGSEEPGGGRRR